MYDLFIGCRTDIPVRQDWFFNVEMTADSYPTEDQAEELKDFLQPHTLEIIDEVVYVMDANSGELIWEK